MTLEKICEYFNDIGILQLDNIEKFLKIYKQISQNNFKNKSDKTILALFTYITLISKNEQELYSICRNIVNNFTNNQILYRYRALNIISNIINTKLKSTYISFFIKLNFFKNKKYFRSKKNSPKIIKLNKTNFIQDEFINDNNNLSGRIKKGKIVKKNKAKKKDENDNNMNINKINLKRNNENKIYRTFDNNDIENEKECTFSPKINKYYKPKKNNQINNEIDSSSFFNKSNDNQNYKKGNNVINEELEKMIDNISKYSGNPNNSKYIPKKIMHRTNHNQIYPSSSYQEMQLYSDPNINIQENNNNYIDKYLHDNYDFYQNEKDYIKKVQDKIFQLKLQKLDKISQECTFSPEINEVPKYLYETKNGENNLTDINYDYENNYKNKIYNINNNLNHNSFNNSKSFSRKRKNKLAEEFSEDYYNVYPKKRKNYSNSRSHSHGKNTNEFSVYKAKREQLNNLFNEKYPFIPSIRENKKYQIKSSFDERQKKFIEDKKKLFEQKEKEQLKEIQEMKKYSNKSKTNIKDLVKKLYDKEAEKIKERLKIEKELSKKKKIIDWDKRNKINKEKNPEDYKINFNPKNKKLIESASQKKIENLINKIQQEKAISKSKSKEKNKVRNNKINSSKNKKKKNEVSLKKDEINKNKLKLIEKIKDEHVIGFKNNISSNPNKLNNIVIPKEENKNEEKQNNTINSKKDSQNINLDNESLFRSSVEEIKKLENEHLMDGINKNVEMRSNALKDLINQYNNK